MTKKLPLYPIVVRREKKTGRIYLFMKDHGEINSYEWNGEHGSSSREWMLTATVPVEDADAKRHFESYINNPYPWEGESIPVLRKRIPY